MSAPKQLTGAMIALGLVSFPAWSAEKPIGVLLVAADITGCDESNMAQARATALRLAKEAALLRKDGVPVKVVIAGDLAYPDGTEEEFACFDKAWGAAVSDALADPGNDVLPAPGNHEYESPGAKPYFAYFKSNDWVVRSPQGYYDLSFPEGGADAWHLFGLNSELSEEGMSEEKTWFKKTLDAGEEPCLLAFWHRPVLSSGTHGKGDDSERMAGFLKVFSVSGGSVVLNGHDHNYEELGPHDETGEPRDKGLRSFVVGTGGRPLRPLDEDRWPAISRNFDSQTHGILRLDLYPGRYNWHFLPAGGDQPAKYTGEGVCAARPDAEKP